MPRLKPLDLRSLPDETLAQWLSHDDVALRRGAFQELGARGEKRGWEVYGVLTRDPELAGLFVSPKDPFDGVGVVVEPETLQRVRRAWPEGREQVFSNGGRELTIDFRNLRLDVVSLAAPALLEGEMPALREGLGEVEFRVTDVAAFAARLEKVADELRGRLTLLPQSGISPVSGAAPSRFLLAQVPFPASVESGAFPRTVLVQIIQSPK